MNHQRTGPYDDLFARAAMDYYLGESPGGAQPDRPLAQRVPVNAYQTEDEIVLVAPMPGVEADNIDIQVHGTTVRLAASLRGPHHEDRHYLLHEWTYGPYVRVIELPTEVDASRANASHDNGILVVTLPKLPKSRAVQIPLKSTSSSATSRGEHNVAETSS